MTGVHEFTFFKISANSVNVLDFSLPTPSLESCFVAKLVNIPDIHRVSRLAFDVFLKRVNSHGPLAQTCSEVP